ncbi:fungal-specific transcription factor domain-containing protein [Favolaschia claudopus]|uniref:Fungal-specific transcription factor domain-containing protein n=1 Tax=Favolaschia claudopus TaxID=2862362 RepID=A0AAV9ZME6_9AGAR
MLGGFRLWYLLIRLLHAQAHVDWPRNPLPAPVTINGGTGGAGGASRFWDGGAGGNGEGPQIHHPAVATYNVQGNVHYSYHYSSSYCTCNCNSNCNCGDSVSKPTAEVVLEVDRIVRKVRQVAEYIHGKEERTVAIIYYNLYRLFPPDRSKHWQSNPRDTFNDFLFGDPDSIAVAATAIAAWSQHGIANLSQAVVHGRFPVYASSFSDTYHARFEDEDMWYGLPIVEDDCNMVVNNIPLSALFNMQYFPSKPGGANDELVTHYLGNVMELQHLLADRSQIQSILIPSVTSPSAAQHAARLLAAIHSQRATYRSHSFIALQVRNTARQYEELLQVLQETRHSEDDALAAISIISSFLFDGGSGAWQAWLKVSYDYARSVFQHHDPKDTLQKCSERTRFIVKTAIWFDVLAAVTTQESPRFLRYIHELYSPENSSIYDPALPSPPALSMLSVMGCENQIVWALAEASDLAVWKRTQQEQGHLSMPELVQRGTRLEQYLTNKSPSYLNCTTAKTDKEIARELSSDIFRGATLVYVRSIVSGDFPHVHEITQAILETMGYARTTVSHGQKVYSSVVRSTVFAFFICGALSDDPQVHKQVEELLSLSEEDPSLSTMGNASSIRRLLDKIWAGRRTTGACAPVPWRDVLKDANMLLV